MKKVMTLLIVLMSTLLMSGVYLEDRQFRSLGEGDEEVLAGDRYYSRDYRYSIAFPSDWELAMLANETSLAALSPREDQFDFFRENVLVGSFGLSVSDNLDDYFDGNLEFLKQQIPDMEVDVVDRTKLDGIDAIRLVYTSTISETRVKTMQVFAVRNGRGYIITAMAVELSYADYEEVFAQIVKSFRFE